MEGGRDSGVGRGVHAYVNAGRLWVHGRHGKWWWVWGNEKHAIVDAWGGCICIEIGSWEMGNGMGLLEGFRDFQVCADLTQGRRSERAR